MDKQDYSEAVRNLVKLAQSDTGGSRVAAQVLLSAYNGEFFQLDIVDLIYLGGGQHYQDALTVIRGRVELNIEPHLVIENGSSIFNNLCDDWRHLHVSNRGKM